MMKKQRLTSILFLLLIAQYSIAQLSADEIIKKNLALTGFDKQTIHSFEIDGYFQQGAGNIKMHMIGILPDFFKMEAVIDSVTVVKCTNGTYSWEYSSVSDSLIFKEPEDNMSENFYYQWTGGLDRYIRGEITAELIGNEKLENIEVYKLKLIKNNKIRYYYIDKLSFLILKIENLEKNESTYYIDYRMHNGFLLPHVLNGYKGNTAVMSILIKNIKINTPIDKQLFNAPKK